MKIWKLSIRNILSRPGTTLMNLILLSVGIALVSVILLIRNKAENYFQKNLQGIDMVVGAKGSPLQLVLSAVYHIDAPTGNIPLKEVEMLLRNPLIESGIPLSYGDNFKGFRIVGTTTKLPELYKATLQEGNMWTDDFDVVIGSEVAKRADLIPGDEFVGVHGLVEEGSQHNEHVYRVVGIFSPTNSVFDKLILTSTESIWKIHNHGHDEAAAEDRRHDHHKQKVDHELPDKEVTALLINFRNPVAMISLPRMVNEQTSMQAALPVYEIEKLFTAFGVGLDIVEGIAIIIIGIAGLSLFISLFNILKERMYEFALIRTYGGTRYQVMEMVLLEGLIMSIAGYLIGVCMARGFMLIIPVFLEETVPFINDDIGLLNEELLLLAFSIGIGIVAALLPAIAALKMNISKILADE